LSCTGRYPGPRHSAFSYDVKVVAIDISEGYGGQASNIKLVNAEGWAARTFDNVAYEPGSDGEVKWAQPVELKSEGAALSSVKGGPTEGDIAANLCPSSTLAGQLQTTGSLRRRASDLGGTLVLKGRDAITNEEVVIRVDPDRLGPERVTSYGRLPDVVATDVPPDGSPFPLEAAGPASGAPRTSSSSPTRTLDDILTSDRGGFTERAVASGGEERKAGPTCRTDQ
jgi:hypothetical protein